MYKIMSTNVLGKYGKHIDEDAVTEERMKIIADYIGAVQPDSVGIQEYGSRNQIYLSKHLPSNYTLVEFDQRWISTLYNSDKFEVEAKNCVRLTTSSKQGYRFTWAVLRHVGGELAYIHGNLHLEYKDSETRLIDAKEVNREIGEILKNSQYRKLPMVITGDYNAKLENEPEVFDTISEGLNIKSALLIAHSAEKGQATFHELGKPSGEGRALDHALIRCDTAEVYKHDIIKEDDYAPIVNASDHYPVIVEFTSKENITC